MMNGPSQKSPCHSSSCSDRGFGALLAGPATAQSDNPGFTQNSRGNLVINEVYVSSSGVRSRGRDRLGRNVLPPERGISVVLPAGQCANDIRVV